MKKIQNMKKIVRQQYDQYAVQNRPSEDDRADERHEEKPGG